MAGAARPTATFGLSGCAVVEGFWLAAFFAWLTIGFIVSLTLLCPYKAGPGRSYATVHDAYRTCRELLPRSTSNDGSVLCRRTGQKRPENALRDTAMLAFRVTATCPAKHHAQDIQSF